MELKEENKRLKEKLKAFTEAHKDDKVQKKAYKAIGTDEAVRATRDAQKVKDLLKMIEILKKYSTRVFLPNTLYCNSMRRKKIIKDYKICSIQKLMSRVKSQMTKIKKLSASRQNTKN